jgi:hypothetical protein
MKMIVKKLNEIEVNLNRLSTLYLSGHKNPLSFSNIEMEEFILQFLDVMCQERNTVCSDTGKVETNASRRRSIGDIYRLCKYYYDNVTLLEVQYILAKLCTEKKIGYFYCNNNKKRVYMSYDFYGTHTVNPKEYPNPDEYGITPKEIDTLAVSKFENLIE